MNKSQLIKAVAEKSQLSQKQVGETWKLFEETILETLKEGDKVQLSGFGTFEAKKKNERVVTNPSSGKRMLVPPKITLGFKVSNVLKSKLKN